MKNLIIFGVFVVLLVLLQYNEASAQTLDEIADKNVAAMGGKEKLVALKSVRKLGNMNVQGADVSITVVQAQDKGIRTDFSVMNTENYVIITPTKGWAFMPVYGQTSPEEFAADQQKAEAFTIDPAGPFLNYKERGIALELLGKETVDGAENFKIKATYKNGSVVNYFVDTKTFRVNKLTYKTFTRGSEAETFASFTDYKQDKNGYWFAYSMTNPIGQADYASIEANVVVDDNIFKAN